MPEAFVAGVFAGYGVAIPVGAIAVLIIETGTRNGLWLGISAGAGAATADGLYATLAALFGVALAAAVAPLVGPLRAAAVVVLAVIAARGLLELWMRRPDRRGEPARDPGPDGRSGASTTYARFLGLTLLNPMTVIYFGALIVGLPSTGEGTTAKAAFVAGAFIASFSWQTLLAAFGALLHRRAPPALRVAVSLVGYLIVLAFAARIALDLLAG